MEYQVGDIVRTKKVHPCGSKLWEITRIGVDFKLKCEGCRTRNYCRKTQGFKNDYKENRKRINTTYNKKRILKVFRKYKNKLRIKYINFQIRLFKINFAQYVIKICRPLSQVCEILP
jgi:hypothetical protein